MGDHVDDERHVNSLRKKRRFCVHKRQHCVRPMIGAPACKSCDFKKDSPISGGFVERKDNCCIMHTHIHYIGRYRRTENKLHNERKAKRSHTDGYRSLTYT